MQPCTHTVFPVLAALVALSAPGLAVACGHGGAGGASSSAGGSGSGHVSSSTGGGGRGSHQGTTELAMPDLGSPTRWPMELAVEATVQTLSLSNEAVQGWADHPALAGALGNAPYLPGRTLGLGAMLVAGGAVRWDTVFGGHFLLGLRFGHGLQGGTNTPVSVGGHTVQLDPGGMFDGGIDVGVIVPLPAVSLRAELYAGLRMSSWVVQGIGNAGCDTPPLIETGQLLLQPRAEVDWNLTQAFSLGAYVSMDVLHLGDLQSGLVVSLHGHPFAVMAPAAPAGLPVDTGTSIKAGWHAG